MSKQTINIGASPNDGTGTPLRTSFDYTNQNFTEIYTALGGGVALPGATTQVIFNDGGTNLAGDAGLVYNKTTDALTVAGLVTAGSATITGDLTVRTDKLAVTSTGVGAGTATPACPLEVYKNTNGQNRLFLNNPSTGAAAYNSIDFTAGTAGNQIVSLGSGFSGSFPYLTGALVIRSGQVNGMVLSTGGSAAGIQFGINDTPAMTLNGTGLGVGGSVLAKISAYLTSTATYNSAAAGDDTDFQIGRVNNSTVSGQSSTIALNSSSDNGATVARVYLACVQESNASYASSFTVKTRNSAGTNAERLRIDSSGNVGIGVTPSGLIYSVSETRLVVKGTSNSFAGTLAVQSKGTTNAVTGFLTAGDNTNEVAVGSTTNSPLNFYTNNALKATIDASGNLILQSSATPATLGTNGMLTVNATSNTNLRFSYRGSDGTTRVANITLA